MPETTEEPTYTLDEARRVMALRECATHGHSWNVIENGSGPPLRLHCDCCGWSGRVEMGERPTTVT